MENEPKVSRIIIFEEGFLGRYVLPYVEEILDIYKHCRETGYTLGYYIGKIRQQCEVLQTFGVNYKKITKLFFKKMKRVELFLFLDSLEELEDILATGPGWNALEVYENLEVFKYGDIVSRHCVMGDLRHHLDRRTPKDVVLRSGECAIPAHKVILSARSSKFSGIFNSDTEKGRRVSVEFLETEEVFFKRNTEEGRTDSVRFPEMEEAIFKRFVRYLYTDKMAPLDWNSAKKLYELGHQYAVEGLKNLCSKFMTMNLTKERAIECLALANAHSDHDFKTIVMDYMKSNSHT